MHIASNVPGIELLEENDEESDDDVESGSIGSSNNDNESDEDAFPIEEDDPSDEDNVSEHAVSDFSIDHGTDDDNGSGNDSTDEEEDEELSDDDADDYRSEEDEDDEEELDGQSSRQGTSTPGSEGGEKKSKAQKRKFDDFDEKLQAAGNSLRALKKLAGAKLGNDSSDTQDGILSNEDFQKIKELTVF